MQKFRCSQSKRSKILAIVYKRFSRAVSKSLNQVFYKIKQNSVFPGSCSCVVQLLVYLESIYKSIDSKENIDIIYTDYEKASDNVDHGILQTKLFNLGVCGKIIKLLQSYLIGRTQRVRINSHFSESVNVTSGVPQGSLLASLFFVIYVNDLTETCRAVDPLLCADDAKFMSVNKSSLFCQMDLTRVMKWSEQHKLPLNVEKCSHI